MFLTFRHRTINLISITDEVKKFSRYEIIHKKNTCNCNTNNAFKPYIPAADAYRPCIHWKAFP